MTLPTINLDYQIDFLVRLLKVPSPTGYSHMAIDLVEKELSEYKFLTFSRTRKGALVIRWEGHKNNTPRAITAHVDTLGAMIKEIKSNGRLKLTRLGGVVLGGVETEGVTVFTDSGKTVRGSYLINKASGHIYGKEANDTPRTEDSMEVRLDARTTNRAETEALGIGIGDFVAFDTRTELINGFIRSRYLDDKACVANLVSAIKSIADAGLKPAQTTYFHISNYEEVGHGASAGIPAEVQELLVLDMAALGEGQNSDEFNVSLCVKDSNGPYHHEMNNKMKALAEKHNIPFKVDIYPGYGSDGGAFWRAGGDVAVSLIGPGIDASHNYERTHSDALQATTAWVVAYLLSD